MEKRPDSAFLFSQAVQSPKRRSSHEKYESPAKNLKLPWFQASVSVFDRERTLEKLSGLAEQARTKGARLVLFPSLRSVPARLDFRSCRDPRHGEGLRSFPPYGKAAVDRPGPAWMTLPGLHAIMRSNVVVGVVEREAGSWMHKCVFSPDGTLLGKHRKDHAHRFRAVGLGSWRWLNSPVYETELGKVAQSSLGKYLPLRVLLCMPRASKSTARRPRTRAILAGYRAPHCVEGSCFGLIGKSIQ